jgi:hypothetical protein
MFVLSIHGNINWLRVHIKAMVGGGGGRPFLVKEHSGARFFNFKFVFCIFHCIFWYINKLWVLQYFTYILIYGNIYYIHILETVVNSDNSFQNTILTILTDFTKIWKSPYSTLLVPG